MPEYEELAIKNITVHIFGSLWYGHAGMRFYKGKFERFLDEDEVEVYKMIKEGKVYEQWNLIL